MEEITITTKDIEKMFKLHTKTSLRKLRILVNSDVKVVYTEAITKKKK